MSASTLQRAQSVDRFGRSWEGKRVTVVGLGRSGQAAAALLCQVGARVRVTEFTESTALKEIQSGLLAQGAVAVELGGHHRASIDTAEIVVVSPGISENAEPLLWARARSIPIISEIELAYHFCPSPIVGVTGTNGKSSVVTMIARVLQSARRHAVACGNLGVPFSSVLSQLTPESVAVVELSSFQLIGCYRFRPTVAVLLNIGTNHLDRHTTTNSYLSAKARIFQSQTADDWAVINGTQPMLQLIAAALPSRKLFFGTDAGNNPSCSLSPQTLSALSPGCQAVLQAARALGIPDPLTHQVIRESRGLEHRMEFVDAVRGVRFINDSKSTTPDSLVFALTRVRGPVVVIAGGRDKGMDFAPLAGALASSHVRGVILIGESRNKLRPIVESAASSERAVHEAATLDEAVRAAARLSGPGDTVLFSPACASFDMFRNFEERGRAFKGCVRSLARESEASA